MQDTYNIFIDDKLVATSNDLHFTSDSLDLTNLVLVDDTFTVNWSHLFQTWQMHCEMLMFSVLSHLLAN